MRAKMIRLWVAGAFAAFMLGTSISAFPQCTFSAAPSTPSPLAPAVTPIGAYRDLVRSPGRIAADSSGKLYVTDPPSGRVFVRDAYGRIVFMKQGLASPLGIAVDASGNILVGEEGSGSVTIFDASWNPIGKLGQGDGEFQLPNHIAIDPGTGSVYVSDSAANMVKVYSPSGAFTLAFGGSGALAGQFDFPTGIFVSPLGEIFVADQNNNRIQVFNQSGQFTRCFIFGKKSMMGGTYKLGRVQGITGDATGRLYIADTFQGYVQVFDAAGTDISTIGSFGEGPGQLQSPVGLAIDRFNRLFVSSVGNTRVEIFGLDTFSNPTAIQAIVEFRPTTSDKKTITAYIEVPGATPDRIDVSTVKANGVPADSRGIAIIDYDADGVLELQVKFDLNALLSTLPTGDAVVSVTGQLLDGTPFAGSALVTVLPK